MQTPSGTIRRILVATDSLKGTCSAIEAAAAISGELTSRMPGVEIDRCPLGDGGEGTLDVLAAGQALHLESRSVIGPRRDRPAVDARFGISEDRRLAVVELAEAAGLGLLAHQDRDPRRTGTGGVGDLLIAARGGLEFGGDDRPILLLAAGGSGTVDGGIGALSRMGVEFFGADGPMRSPLIGEDLPRIRRIEVPAPVRAAWAAIDLRVAVDVHNPLLGPMGAARIFGPQKGADGATVEFLEHGLESWVEVVGHGMNAARASDAASSPGAGAAGGIAFALQSIFGAGIESGFDLVADRIDLEERVRIADLVVTSEGRLDAQSMMGKATGRLLDLAAIHGTPVAAIPGSIGDLPPEVRDRFLWIRSLSETCGESMATSAPSKAMATVIRLAFPDSQ